MWGGDIMNKKAKYAILTTLMLMAILIIAVALAAPKAPKACRDGVDNDGDGYADWPSDPGCRNKNDNSELDLNVECDDGIDNDGDFNTDYPDDSGCSGPTDNSELNLNVECDDGIDNDGDTNTDYPDDSGCSSPTDNDETNCGDTVCEGGETSQNCPEDCGSPDSCSDTDGGWVPELFGTVSGDSAGLPYAFDDNCLTSDLLQEWYCIGDTFSPSNVSCSMMNFTGCSNGACY